MTTPARIKPTGAAPGYTLFEILLALAIVAVLLGISVPLVMESIQQSQVEAAVKILQETALSAHSSALETGVAERLEINDRGLISMAPGVPHGQLPEGCKLQVRRFTESRFRRPGLGEYWEFNGAGICEPITLKIIGEQESAILQFDPLTAQVIPANE
jgi:prepilin-type N-terminal cleavage/methylation domain-containing protein